MLESCFIQVTGNLTLRLFLARILTLHAFLELVMKASHTFNLLDARHAISVTERQRYILRVRNLAKAAAQAYYASRAAMGFPQADADLRAQALEASQ